MNSVSMKPIEVAKGPVYCPICTRTVEAQLMQTAKKRVAVKPGQRCAHCGASLDAAFALLYNRAA